MANFRRADIEPLDDGTFAISIQLPDKKGKRKDGSECCEYQEPYKCSTNSLKEALEKIEGYGEKGPKKAKTGEMKKALGMGSDGE